MLRTESLYSKPHRFQLEITVILREQNLDTRNLALILMSFTLLHEGARLLTPATYPGGFQEYDPDLEDYIKLINESPYSYIKSFDDDLPFLPILSRYAGVNVTTPGLRVRSIESNSPFRGVVEDIYEAVLRKFKSLLESFKTSGELTSLGINNLVNESEAPQKDRATAVVKAGMVTLERSGVLSVEVSPVIPTT